MTDSPEIPGELDLSLERDEADKLYSKGSFGRINPLRKERIFNEIPFEDLVQELTGQVGNSQDKILCPVHGESTPSFQLYKRSNSGWCFGCSPGRQFYDHIRLTSELTGMSWIKALSWLEKKWNLPPIADLAIEDEEDAEEEEESTALVRLTFDDLVEPFMIKAESEVQEFQDPDLAEEYQSIYFDALHLMEMAKKARTEHDDAEDGAEEAREIEMKAVLLLARVVGRNKLQELLRRKY